MFWPEAPGLMEPRYPGRFPTRPAVLASLWDTNPTHLSPAAAKPLTDDFWRTPDPPACQEPSLSVSSDVLHIVEPPATNW